MVPVDRSQTPKTSPEIQERDKTIRQLLQFLHHVRYFT